MPVFARQQRPASPQAGEHSGFAADVVKGLSGNPKRIPPKHFYDAEGSRLFEEITRQSEYYPTRTEIGILRAHGRDIASLIPDHSALIEFGSGAFTKAKILLDAAPAVKAYVPVDISPEFLEEQAAELAASAPGVAVHPVAADFTTAFPLPESVQAMHKIGFFPGSTIGNFEPRESAAFLRQAAGVLGRGSLMIVGTDLLKDEAILNAAYNDAAGVTAAFNCNLLRRINRELGGDFDLDGFDHRAFFNRERNRVEMHLVSSRLQTATVSGVAFRFRPGESIHTESSYKFGVESFVARAAECGWQPVGHWTDTDRLFCVHALRAQ